MLYSYFPCREIFTPLVNRTTMPRPFLTVSDASSPVIDRIAFCLFDTQLNLNYFIGDWILSNGYIHFTVWPWQRITDWATLSSFWRTETLQQGMARLVVFEVCENLSSHLSYLLVFLSSIFGDPFFCLMPTFSFSWCYMCVYVCACVFMHASMYPLYLRTLVVFSLGSRVLSASSTLNSYTCNGPVS